MTDEVDAPWARADGIYHVELGTGAIGLEDRNNCTKMPGWNSDPGARHGGCDGGGNNWGTQ